MGSPLHQSISLTLMTVLKMADAAWICGCLCLLASFSINTQFLDARGTAYVLYLLEK